MQFVSNQWFQLSISLVNWDLMDFCRLSKSHSNIRDKARWWWIMSHELQLQFHSEISFPRTVLNSENSQFWVNWSGWGCLWWMINELGLFLEMILFRIFTIYSNLLNSAVPVRHLLWSKVMNVSTRNCGYSADTPNLWLLECVKPRSGVSLLSKSLQILRLFAIRSPHFILPQKSFLLFRGINESIQTSELTKGQTAFLEIPNR
jgi:hypothetical protein